VHTLTFVDFYITYGHANMRTLLLELQDDELIDDELLDDELDCPPGRPTSTITQEGLFEIEMVAVAAAVAVT
jgi:hypothetical protein